MTHETLTNPFFVAAYLFVIIATAALLAYVTIYLQDRHTQKKLDQISEESAACIAADKKKHSDFMDRIHKIENCDWNRLDLLTDATKAYRLALNAKYGEDSERLCNKMDRLTEQFARINKIDMPLAERIRDSHHFVPA
jgi:Skp family chaperone for outer membrane proteins